MTRILLSPENSKECNNNARDSIKGCLICPVSFECLSDVSIKVDGTCYDAHSLVGWFLSCIEQSRQPTIPHNRRLIPLPDADSFLAKYDALRYDAIVSELYRVYGYDIVDDAHELVATAVRKHDWDLLRYLIAHKSSVVAEVQYRARHQLSVWHVIAQHGHPPDVLHGLFVLIRHVDVNVRAHDQDWSTPMHFAAAYNRIGLMKRLKARGGDVNAKDAEQTTPIMWAVRAGYIASARWLIQAGADLEMDDIDGYTAAHHACDNPDLCDEDVERPPRHVVLQLLFAECPNQFFIRNRNGHTVLHLAVRNAMFHTVKWLVENVYKCDLRQPDAWIVDALHTTVDDLGNTMLHHVDDMDDTFIEWHDNWFARYLQ